MSIPGFFHLKNCVHLPLSILDNTFFPRCLFPTFHFPEFVENFEKKLHKTLNNEEKFRNTVTISSLKTTGQLISTLVNVFNIPIQGVCRSGDRNCIKTLKIGKILDFVSFGANVRCCSFRKLHSILRKSPLD